MVQLPIRFFGITLHFMLCSVSGASTASIESTAHSPTLATANSTTEPIPVSVFLLYMKITNRIFNESLKNQSSGDYKELRAELTQLLDDVYTSESHNYTGITAMTFSEGSVVANTTLAFKTQEISPYWVENQFLSYVKKNPPRNLHLNISYTEEQGIPLPDVGHQENATTGAAIMTAMQSLKTATEATVNHTFTSLPGITTTETPPFTHNTGSVHNTTYYSHSEHNTTNNVSALTDSIRSTTITINDTAIPSNGTTGSPTSESTQSQLTPSSNTTTSHPLNSSAINSVTNFTTSLSISIGFTRNTSFVSSNTDNSSSDTSSPEIYSTSPTVHPPGSTSMTTVVASSHNTTIHSTHITSTTSLSITQSLPLASTTGHPINGTTNTSGSSTTMFATTSTPNSTSPHTNPVTITEHASSLPATTARTSSSPLGTTTPNLTARTSSAPHTSPTSSASASTASTTTAAPGRSSQVVPGWAIALLVLASLILLFLILLFAALLAYWCCKRRQYDFMNMSEDAGIYDQVNHGADIPMYTTHGHYESTNGKPYEDAEKPMKNRTMYTVNKR